MKLNRKLVLVLALVLSLALATGGTLAYLTDTDADVNVMTLGNVKIVQNEQQRAENGVDLVPFENNQPAYPAVGPIEWADAGVKVNGTEYKVFTDELANVIDKIVTVTNTGKSDAYVRTIIAIEAPGFDAESYIHMNINSGEALSYSDWLNVTIDGVDYCVVTATYKGALPAGATSVPSLMQLFLDSKADNDYIEPFGDTWEVLVLSQAVQTAGFDSAEVALNTAFGEVTAKNVETWLGEAEVGSPGEDWPNNNPPIIPEEAIVPANAEELIAALKTPGAVVYVPEGTYSLNGFGVAEGVTVFGMSEDVVIEGYLTGTVKNVTLENLHITGSNSQRWAYAHGENVFKNCTFEATGVYSLHFDSIGEGAVLTYEDCDFIGWCAFGSGMGPYELTFDGCSLTGNGTYGLIRCYRDATIKDCTFDVADVNPSDVYQDGIHACNGATIQVINCTNVNGTMEDIANISGDSVINIQ